MLPQSGSFFGIPRQYQPLMQELGLVSVESIFTDPRIVPWRSIPERENCTLDATLSDGRPIRLHVKRFHAMRGPKPPGEQEADGILKLNLAKVPTVPLVAWGKLADGRSFLISEDLGGYQAADKLIAAGIPFDRLLEPTADLAAKLHTANLHHRDLYLCHFFAKVDGQQVELRLIDPGRVGYLPAWLFRTRWIVKDLAQFWYSTLQLPITDAQREQWLQRYAQQARVGHVDRLRRKVQRKVAAIARHDRRLNAAQPQRNISIPVPPSEPRG